MRQDAFNAWPSEFRPVEDDDDVQPGETVVVQPGTAAASDPYTQRVPGSVALRHRARVRLTSTPSASTSRPSRQRRARRRASAPVYPGRAANTARLAAVSLVALLLITCSFFVLLSLHVGSGVDPHVGSAQLVEATTTATLAVPSPGDAPTAQPTAQSTYRPNKNSGGGGAGASPTATPLCTSGCSGGGGGPPPTVTPVPKATATPLPQPTATDTPRPLPTNTLAPTATPDTRTIMGPATLTSCGSGCDIPGLGIAGTHGESGTFATTGRSVTLSGPVTIGVLCFGPGCKDYHGSARLSAQYTGGGTLTCFFSAITIPANSNITRTCTWNLSSPSFVPTDGWFGAWTGSGCSGTCGTFRNSSGPLTQQVSHWETGSDCTKAKATLRSRGTSWANSFISGAQNGRTLAGKSINFTGETCSPGPGASVSSFTARNTTVANAFAYFPGDAQVWARAQLDALLPPGYTWQSVTSCTPSTVSWSSTKATLNCQDTGIAVRTSGAAVPLGVFMTTFSTPPAQASGAGWRSALRLLDGLLLLLVLALLAPVLLTLARMPIVAQLSLRPATLPALWAAALAFGTTASLLLGRIQRLAVAFLAILTFGLGVAGLIVAGLTLGTTGAPMGVTGPALPLFGRSVELAGVVVVSWIVLLLVGVPLLVLLARQIWLVAPVAIGTLALGLSDLSPLALRLVVGWTLATALLLMGLVALREKLAQASRLGLARHGPVLRQELRAILVPALGIALLASLFTVSVQPIGALAQGLQRALRFQPAGTRLLVQDPSAHSVLLPTSTLDTAAPPPMESAASARTPVLTYQLLDGPEAWFNPDPVANGAPPFLIQAFTEFDGRSWRVGASTALRPTAPAPSASQLTPLWRMRVALAEQPRAFGTSAVPLPIYGQTYRVSLAQARVRTSDGQHPEGFGGWQAPGPLPAGTTYELRGLDLAAVPASAGTLDPALQQTLTTLPPGLGARLRPLALALIGNATGQAGQAGQAGQVTEDVARAHALLDGMAHSYMYDPNTHVPPGTADPLDDFLSAKRGDLTAWTSAYVALGRSVGLPLRLAVGYLAGAWEQASARWVVRHQDATVWAQLALPGLGYQDEFAVAPKLLIQLPKLVPLHNPPADATPTPTSASSGGAVAGAPPNAPDVVETLRTASVLLVLLLALLALSTLLVARVRWWRVLLALPPSLRPLGQLVARAQAAQIGLSPAQTPLEASTRIAEAAALDDDGAAVLRELGATYAAYRYGGQPFSRSLAHTAWTLARRPLGRRARHRWLRLTDHRPGRSRTTKGSR